MAAERYPGGFLTERRDFWGEVLSKASTVKVRNVMNPLLWLNAVVIPALLAGAYSFKDAAILAAPLILGALAIPAWTMLEYGRFARKDPARLHSEEYLIEQQRLTIESKGDRIPVNVTALPASDNPELKQIADFSEERGDER